MKLRNRATKMLAVLLTLVMLCGCMAACGEKVDPTEAPKATDAPKATEAPKATDAPETEGPEEPVKLTIWIQERSDVDYETCMMTTELEKRLNVDLEFVYYSSATDGGTAYNLLLTSGEYPDIILGNKSSAQVLAGITAGALLPLNDYIVEGTNFKARLDENPNWETMLTANDGKIYAFPHDSTPEHVRSEYKMWYRPDWLENLGWEEEPVTPEEFKQFLIDVRDKDANGNGDPDDEIPLMGYYGGRKSDPICFLMNPFELYTDNYYYITDEGDLHFSAVTDGWRKGLAYIADLYAEGLIAEETYVQDESTFKALLNKPANESIVGVCSQWRINTLYDTSLIDWFDYVALTPLKGDYQQTAATMDGRFQMVGAISSQCENPEKAFEFMDYMLTDEFCMLYLNGIEGVSYEVVQGEALSGADSGIKAIEGVSWDEMRWQTGYAPKIETMAVRYAAVKDESTRDWHDLYYSLISEPYYVNHNTPTVVWAEDDVMAEVGEYSSIINDYILTADTEFIMGIRDINDDAQWQAYLDELDAMGLQEYIELLNVYYGLK